MSGGLQKPWLGQVSYHLLDSSGNLRRSAFVVSGLVLGTYPGFGNRLLRGNNSTGDLLSFEGSCRQTYSFGTASTNEIFRRFAVSGIISECGIILPANHANEREWPCCELIVRLGDEAGQAIGHCRADGLMIDRLRLAGVRVKRSSYSRSLA